MLDVFQVVLSCMLAPGVEGVGMPNLNKNGKLAGFLFIITKVKSIT